MTIFHGTKKNDNLDGTSGNDTFDLYKGGSDAVRAGGGDDRFNMGASLDASDRLDGGAGRDVVFLHGDYSAGVTFDDDTITNVEVLRLGAGFDYKLTLADGNVAAGAILGVNAAKLGAGDSLTFDGSAETDGRFAIYAGAGDDLLTGGAKKDVFHLDKGGNDTAHGGGGNDTFYMGAAFTASDVIDGGAGSDTLYARFVSSASILTFSSAQITNIETLNLVTPTKDNRANIVGDLAGGGTLNIVVGSAHLFGIDFTAATSAGYAVTGGIGEGNGFHFAGNLHSTDKLLASGVNTLELEGDYSGGLTLSAANLNNMATVKLDAGFSYALSVVGAFGTSGFIHFDAAIDAGHTGTFDFRQAMWNYLYLNGSGAGDFTVKVAGNLTADDRIWAGTGNNTLELAGDYSAGLVLESSNSSTKPTIANFDTLKLDDGFGYKFTIQEDIVADGATMAVDASALTGSHALILDVSGETNGFYTVKGGAGDDWIKFGANFKAGNSVDGGAGSDTLELSGDYNTTFGAGQLVGVETLKLDAGHNYFLTENDGNVASGRTLTVDLGAVTGAVSFNGLAELDGNFHFIAGAGVGGMTLTGGAGNDVYDLTAVATSPVVSLDAKGGNDTFLFAGDFNNFTPATPIAGNGGDDTIELNGDYSSLILGTTVESIETFRFDGGHGYGNVTIREYYDAPAVVTVDASQVGTLFHLTFDNSAFIVEVGSGGMDAGAGGTIAYDDTFILTSKSALSASTIDAGDGSDTLELNGDFSSTLVLGAATAVNFETFKLDAGHSYDLVASDGTVAAGATLKVDGSALTGLSTLSFTGSNESDGHFAFIGGAGDDSLIGGALSNTFDLTHGGIDTAQGGGGNDTFSFGAAWTVDDVVDGGAGNDTVTLTNVLGTLNFTDSTIQNVETLVISVKDGADAEFKTTDANVAAGSALTVDFSGSGPLIGMDGTFDGSAELDGHFHFIEPQGVHTSFQFAGGAQSDTLTVTHPDGGSNIFNGLGGDDTLETTASASAVNFFGGAGNDTVALTGGGTLGGGWISLDSVETMTLDDNNWNIGFSFDTTIAAGNALTVDGTALTSAHTLSVDGSEETDSSFTLKGGAGNDTLIGGGLADNFVGGFGADTMTGGGGADVFYYGPAIHSTSTTYDTITDFAAGTDKLDLIVTVNQVYSASGSLDSGANFNSELGGLNAMHIGGATEITVTGGTLAGHIFLLVDGDGNATYNAGFDYVIDITGHTGTLTTADFI